MRFSVSRTSAGRVHHVDAEDVRVVIRRLPPELLSRLRAIHFNDRSLGARRLGYVNWGHREIALCALPTRISLTRFLRNGQRPDWFGAQPGRAWPTVAVRRFMLYVVFLHELGHLQVVKPTARTEKRRFALERRAQEFAMHWCRQLWSEPFDHPDPAHNRPTAVELGDEDPDLTDGILRSQLRPDDGDRLLALGKLFMERRRYAEAREAYERAIGLDPRDPWKWLFLGNCHYGLHDFPAAVRSFTEAAELLPDRAIAFVCRADVERALGRFDLAERDYRQALAIEPSDRLARRKLREWEGRAGIRV